MNLSFAEQFLKWIIPLYTTIHYSLGTALVYSSALFILFITLGKGVDMLIRRDQIQEFPFLTHSPIFYYPFLLIALILLTPLLAPLSRGLITLLYLIMDHGIRYLFELIETKQIIHYCLGFVLIAISLGELIMRQSDDITDKLIASLENQPLSKSLMISIFLIPLTTLINISIILSVSHYLMVILLSIIN